jgi:hypothetical protein
MLENSSVAERLAAYKLDLKMLVITKMVAVRCFVAVASKFNFNMRQWLLGLYTEIDR